MPPTHRPAGGGGGADGGHVSLDGYPPRSAFPTTALGYELREKIGQGTTGAVFRAYCPAVDREVAVKIFDLEWCQSPWERIWNEVGVMAGVEHRNVVRLLTAMVQGTDVWLVTPMYAGGSVAAFMGAASPGGLEENMVAYVLREICCAVEYFHGQGQIHRDIKAGNLLLDARGAVFLSDFGVMGWMTEAGETTSKHKRCQTFIGSPLFMAPEVMQQSSGYDTKADIWSIGITAIELATGRAPYADDAPMVVLVKILDRAPPTVAGPRAKAFSKDFHDFVAACLQKDPAKRPTAAQLLQHRLLRNAKKPANLEKRIAELPPLGSRASSQADLYRQLQRIEIQRRSGGGGSGIQGLIENGLGWDFGDDDENDGGSHGNSPGATDYSVHSSVETSALNDSVRDRGEAMRMMSDEARKLRADDAAQKLLGGSEPPVVTLGDSEITRAVGTPPPPGTEAPLAKAKAAAAVEHQLAGESVPAMGKKVEGVTLESLAGPIKASPLTQGLKKGRFTIVEIDGLKRKDSTKSNNSSTSSNPSKTAGNTEAVKNSPATPASPAIKVTPAAAAAKPAVKQSRFFAKDIPQRASRDASRDPSTERRPHAAGIASAAPRNAKGINDAPPTKTDHLVRAAPPSQSDVLGPTDAPSKPGAPTKHAKVDAPAVNQIKVDAPAAKPTKVDDPAAKQVRLAAPAAKQVKMDTPAGKLVRVDSKAAKQTKAGVVVGSDKEPCPQDDEYRPKVGGQSSHTSIVSLAEGCSLGAGPLDLITTLQEQISQIIRENESLRNENEAFREMIKKNQKTSGIFESI